MAKMPSSGCPLSNDTFPDSMHPLAQEEREAQGLADKNTDKQVFTGFNRMDNIVSLINSETWGKKASSSSCPRLPV
ncbi:hypothetical protein TNCV_3397351 [Trichonephila clavipes]|nr:hypothetical protein TNCV_3397351 [Trichonephila clavipes]